MLQKKIEAARGLLDPAVGQRHFQLRRYLPSAGIDFFIEHYWIVRWDLAEGESYVSENLPYPNVNLVYEQDRLVFYGPVSGKFSRELRGRDWVFGIKFFPGTFFPILAKDLSAYCDLSLPLVELLPEKKALIEEAELRMAGDLDDSALLESGETFLAAFLPQEDPKTRLVKDLLASMQADPAVTKVAGLCGKLGVNKRFLQRLFYTYVGQSPKKILERFRIFDAIDELNKAEEPNWAKLAQDLGYFDQAHFSKAVKSFLGFSPGTYRAKLRLGKNRNA